MSRNKNRPSDVAPPEHPFALQIDWHRVIDDLGHESDRGVALLAAAYLDSALTLLLESSFAGGKTVIDKLLNTANAPLGTLSSRITMAYALGHIGPRYFHALESIREIRNAFAHFRRDLSFEDPEIRQWIVSTFTLSFVLPHPPPDLSAMRNRYIWTTAMILGYLSSRQLLAKAPAVPDGG